jgi:hypothetical protein
VRDLTLRIPKGNLPALHEELKDKIENVAPSYRAALRDALLRPRAQPLAEAG